VLTSAEARVRARGKPWSFLHVSKPEIDLADDIDPYDPAVYAKAAENLRRMAEAGVLVRDAAPCYTGDRLTRGDHVQTGLAAVASLAAYETNRIRKHEHTTPAKEDDRVRQIEAVNAQTGPVMMAYPASPELDALIAAATDGAPDVDVTADDGVRHVSWLVREPAAIARITDACERLPALYIADGHHRSAAAARVSALRSGVQGGPEAPHRYFLSVIFPHHEMRILDYNRIVRDLKGLSVEEFLAALAPRFSIARAERPVRPKRPNEFGMYVPGQWFRLTLAAEHVPADDPTSRLAVSLLAANLLVPVLGIADQRRDKRVDFVGGARGLEELERRVSSGEMAVAFSLAPPRLDDVMAVADAGEVMPPKSTWFEPKLADGLVSHVLD
jgi:uncharacterized protein (DUF1015 family)